MRPSPCSSEQTTASSASRVLAWAVTCRAMWPASTAFSISVRTPADEADTVARLSTSFRPIARWPMDSVPSTMTARETVLISPNIAYIALLARRSTRCVSAGSDSTVLVMLNSRSSSLCMAPTIWATTLEKPGRWPCSLICFHSISWVVRESPSPGGMVVMICLPYSSSSWQRQFCGARLQYVHCIGEHHRPAGMVALHQAAALRYQELQLFLVLDALRHRRQI